MKFSIAILLTGAALSLAACNSKSEEQAANSVVDNSAADNSIELNSTAETDFGNTELADDSAPANETEVAPADAANATTNAD